MKVKGQPTYSKPSLITEFILYQCTGNCSCNLCHDARLQPTHQPLHFAQVGMCGEELMQLITQAMPD